MRRPLLTFAALTAALTAAPLVAAERPSLLVVPAHPDDSAACAGTLLLLRHKYDIHLMDFTAGEAGLGEEGFANGEAKRLRHEEEVEFCKLIGARLYYAGEINAPAGRPELSAFAGRRACETIANLIRKLKPKAVFMHWPIDHHADHAMSAIATMKAIDMSGERPEIYYMEEKPWECVQFAERHYVDITPVVSLRDKAVSLYTCQGGAKLAEGKHPINTWRGQSQMWPRTSYAEVLAVASPVPVGTRIVLDDVASSPFRTKPSTP